MCCTCDYMLLSSVVSCSDELGYYQTVMLCLLKLHALSELLQCYTTVLVLQSTVNHFSQNLKFSTVSTKTYQ